MKAPAFRKLDRLAVWTLVLGLVLAALLPPAVRPLRAASGTLEMVLCSGHGPVSVILDLDSGKPLDRLPASDDRHCSWACCHLAAPVAARCPRACRCRCGWRGPPGSNRPRRSCATAM
ncbi:hypothetical protein ACTTAM_19985 (plasmid) [Rhodobacter capsulatus]|uniref:hypothetical protein n=1 Tax=Rhodobacter capsulatus TaxID=1061 RepID=UPI0040288265